MVNEDVTRTIPLTVLEVVRRVLGADALEDVDAESFLAAPVAVGRLMRSQELPFERLRCEAWLQRRELGSMRDLSGARVLELARGVEAALARQPIRWQTALDRDDAESLAIVIRALAVARGGEAARWHLVLSSRLRELDELARDVPCVVDDVSSRPSWLVRMAAVRSNEWWLAMVRRIAK